MLKPELKQHPPTRSPIWNRLDQDSWARKLSWNVRSLSWKQEWLEKEALGSMMEEEGEGSEDCDDELLEQVASRKVIPL